MKALKSIFIISFVFFGMQTVYAQYQTQEEIRPIIYKMQPIVEEGESLITAPQEATQKFEDVPHLSDIVGKENYSQEDLQCLTEVVYYEARGESMKGKQAVAEVVLNRTKSHKFPQTICGVRNQRYNGKCQFSFACDGSEAKAKNMVMWNVSEQAARNVLDGDIEAVSGGALFFHANYVKSSWFRTLKKTAQIGGHSFYRP